ncbi:MAG: metallophosphoesterase [Isosphaeraceae bacterium]|nr:metallophosphoesterase [Isosphaeraceae bacterium]
MPIHLLPTRRAFLGRLAAGGASLALVGKAQAAPRDDAPTWFALVADTHIAADPRARHRGQCMTDNLRAVVSEILAQADPPRGVIIDGDLALKDGQPGDYEQLLQLTGPLRRADLPLHLALGNHDDRAHFRAALDAKPPAESEISDKQIGIVEEAGLRLVLLDSLDRVNGTPGLLGERQLAWLARHLDEKPEAPTLLFVHHNLADSPTALLDTEALLTVVRPRRQVKAVVFGHTHVWSVRDDDGLHLINLPAVAYPFASNQPLGWCRLQPGPEGAKLTLHAIGGDRSRDGQQLRLRWRTL